MANVWTQFNALLPSKYQYIGEVTAIHSDNTSTITINDGLSTSTIRVMGDSLSIGAFALVEGNRIITEVDDLPTSSQAV